MKLQSTQFLRSTGLLEGYEHVIEKLVTTGWPSEITVFEHAAHELLKFHAENKDKYMHSMAANPGASGLNRVRGGRNFDTNEEPIGGTVDRHQL